MKIQNQLTKALVISDVLVDSVSQYQSGVKYVTLAPNGVTGDSVELPNSIAGESVAIKRLLDDGSLQIVAGGEEKLGGQKVPGVGLGNGIAFQGVVKAARAEAGPVYVYRIMFGNPVVGDEVVDLIINGYPVTAVGDVAVSADALANIVGTVTSAKAVAAVSGNVIVTFTGVAQNDEAGYTVFARLV
jgi:hypothetical protein